MACALYVIVIETQHRRISEMGCIKHNYSHSCGSDTIIRSLDKVYRRLYSCCMMLSLKYPGDLNFKVVFKSVSIHNITDRIHWTSLTPCAAKHQMLFFSLFIFFTLCWQYQKAFWPCCSCPIFLLSFSSLSIKHKCKGRSITQCSLLCHADFKQVHIPKQLGLTPTQPCYCL